MAWDLATAHMVLGIPSGDTSKDAAIQWHMDAVLGLVELYCARQFLLQDQMQSFFQTGPYLLLSRYPVETVTSVTLEGGGFAQPLDWHDEDLVGGIIHLPAYSSWYGLGYCQPSQQRRVDVAYRGGYALLPPALEMTMWEMVAARWAASGGTGSLLPIAGAATGTGDIKRLAIPSVIDVTFDVGSSSSGGGGGVSSGESVSMAGLLPTWREVLELYRSGARWAGP